MNGLRDVMESVNNVALAGVKAGQEIGEREAALKAKPLIEALEEFIRLDDESGLACNDGGELVSALSAARAAIAAYKGATP